jgi:hypothetical protein
MNGEMRVTDYCNIFVHSPILLQRLCKKFDFGAVILIDGGTDSLCFGDEQSMGSPEEDVASLAAVHGLKCNARKFLVSVGWGIDAFHGVNGAVSFNRVV